MKIFEFFFLISHKPHMDKNNNKTIITIIIIIFLPYFLQFFGLHKKKKCWRREEKEYLNMLDLNFGIYDFKKDQRIIIHHKQSLE